MSENKPVIIIPAFSDRIDEINKFFNGKEHHTFIYTDVFYEKGLERLEEVMEEQKPKGIVLWGKFRQNKVLEEIERKTREKRREFGIHLILYDMRRGYEQNIRGYEFAYSPEGILELLEMK